MIHDQDLPDKLAELLHEDELVIFLFHGVIRKKAQGIRNYTGKHINSDLFARCIASVSSVGNALSMDEVLNYSEAQTQYPPKSFAITFDDGFENNISVAAPILADFGVPFTIYVTTDFIERNSMSWIDRIENAVDLAPEQIVSPFWAQEQFALTGKESRIAFLSEVRKFVKTCPACDPNIFADELCSELGGSIYQDTNSELDRKMSWEQVRSAAQSDIISIGGHSHTHPILSFLSPQGLAYELDTCFTLLKEKAGVEPTHFSYPEGLSHCYSADVISQLKQRNVLCSPTAISGRNRVGCDPFHLKRIMVG